MGIYLGLDIGTTAVKTLAIDDQGRVLAEAQREYGFATPQPGWVEQDAEDWWRLTCECVREVAAVSPSPERRGGQGGEVSGGAPEASPPDPLSLRERGGTSTRTDIRALAISTQGDTIVPLDDAGQPLAPAITWMDSRSLAQVARMDEEADVWSRLTGSPPAPFAAAASLLWWRDERPEVFRTARRFALVADFIIGRLTGRYILDAPNASRTMVYDIRRRQWSEELLGRVGVSVERLAETAESGTVVGPLLPEVAAELGLRPETQVVLGGHDQTCAAVGCGVIRPGTLMLSCGTAWVVLGATGKPLFDDTHSLQGYCHAVPGGYAVLGAFAGGNLLRWFRDTLWCEGCHPERSEGPPSCHAERSEAPSDAGGPSSAAAPPPQDDNLDPYDLITAEAAQALAEAAQALADARPPLTFLSHFYGAFGPIRCQAAKGAWAGLTLQHTRGDMALSLLDGVALQTAWTVQNLARQGAASDDIRMIGGGARSRFWAQLVANATGIPIRLPEVREAAAYGAALIAATASGAFASLEEATANLTIRDVIEPTSPPDEAALDRHKELLRALVPIWEELGRL